MTNRFIHDDFLLQNETAVKLYHDVAAPLPIIDYHNHLPPNQILANKNFKNITQIWLAGDHYKWRAMRTCGVDEKFITGDATDKEKFLAWAAVVPKTVKNPLYHWTHMELKNPLGITDRLLNGETAEKIWDECNEMLQSPEFSVRSLLKRNRVQVVATTDDPVNSLTEHSKFQQEEQADFLMIPTFRPDTGMNIEDRGNFRKWTRFLSVLSGKDITTFKVLIEALKVRHDYFHQLGCRASDHGIEKPYSDPFTDEQLEEIFSKIMTGKDLTIEDIRSYKSAFLYYCGLMDHEKGWVFQLHIGAIRNNSSRMMKKLGPDSGFDSMGDAEIARPLARLLNRLDSENNLPKTILYNINPRDNELMATMAGNFQDGSVPGKIQHGPPWWFLDQKDGIEKQIESLSNMGILSEFIGMTTDSRSFLSFSRHDYFRRILCNIIGQDVETGLIPDDENLLHTLIRKICYQNVKNYFNYGE
ncbi:MAG: glucuronate isomerase [Balneolaceae bacterium]|nr:MAG: glucuronate isomerase [Balneolaceae bacterium]